MTDIRNPGDPDSETPPPNGEHERSPFDRPPFDEDPEAQHAPGADPDGPETSPPPMQAGAAEA